MDGIRCLFVLGIACLFRCIENLEGERRIASVIAAKMCKQMCESNSLCFRCQEKELQFLCRTQIGGNTIEKTKTQHTLQQHSNCSSVVAYINNEGLQCLNSYSKRNFGFTSIAGALKGVVKYKCLCIACSEDKLFVGTHMKIKTMQPPFRTFKEVKVLKSNPISMAIDLKKSHLYVGLSKGNQILKMTYRGVTITIFHLIRNYDIMFIEPYTNLLYFAGHSRSIITVWSLLTRKRKESKHVSCKLSSLCIYQGKLFALGYDGGLYVYNEQTDQLLSRHRLSSSSSKREWSCCLLP